MLLMLSMTVSATASEGSKVDCPKGYKCIDLKEYINTGKRIDHELAKLEAFLKVCPRGPLQCGGASKKFGFGCAGPIMAGINLVDSEVDLVSGFGIGCGYSFTF